MDSKTISPVSLDNKKCFEIDSGPSFDGENERVEKKTDFMPLCAGLVWNFYTSISFKTALWSIT